MSLYHVSTCHAYIPPATRLVPRQSAASPVSTTGTGNMKGSSVLRSYSLDVLHSISPNNSVEPGESSLGNSYPGPRAPPRRDTTPFVLGGILVNTPNVPAAPPNVTMGRLLREIVEPAMHLPFWRLRSGVKVSCVVQCGWRGVQTCTCSFRCA